MGPIPWRAPVLSYWRRREICTGIGPPCTDALESLRVKAARRVQNRDQKVFHTGASLSMEGDRYHGYFSRKQENEAQPEDDEGLSDISDHDLCQT